MISWSSAPPRRVKPPRDKPEARRGLGHGRRKPGEGYGRREAGRGNPPASLLFKESPKPGEGYGRLKREGGGATPRPPSPPFKGEARKSYGWSS